MSNLSWWYKTHAARLLERGVPPEDIARIQYSQQIDVMNDHAIRTADKHADEYFKSKETPA